MVNIHQLATAINYSLKQARQDVIEFGFKPEAVNAVIANQVSIYVPISIHAPKDD